VASLAVGPAPPSEARFADAHGLVGACVVMLAVVSQLCRRCRGAVAPTIANDAIALLRATATRPRLAQSRASSALSVALGFATLSAES
jgi:hypothetical protein